MSHTPKPPALPTFAETTGVWLRIGLMSFGGPAGQIALLHREIVDHRRWISERRFLQALNFCSLLPGPEAQQLATYLGWLMHGVTGGLAAGLLFILPGAAVMLGLSSVYAVYGNVPFVAALFFGLKCAVLTLVVQALIRIGRRALHGPAAWLLATLAFVALFIVGLPFPLVVLIAAIIGYTAPTLFNPQGPGAASEDAPALLDALLLADPDRRARLAKDSVRAGAVALLLWLLPVATLKIAVPGTYADVSTFFSKLAVVTVGGAYAVLAYVAQDAVRSYHWLSAQEMLAGLGLAETTPGPLVLVLQFVGFLAGFRATSGPSGLAGGILASLLTLWVTFSPCFAFVFLSAPLVERLQANRALAGALAAVTAAIVGVIANLALWFGLRVMFGSIHVVTTCAGHIEVPDFATLDLVAVSLSVLSAFCLVRLGLSVPAILAIAAVAGLASRLIVAA